MADLIDSIISSASTPVEHDALWVSTGSTIINLACSGRPHDGFRTGRIYNVVGGSGSGKSFLALSMLAEASRNTQFDGYKLVYDDAEAANNFDMCKLFGQDTTDRLLLDSPAVPSDHVEDFFYNVNRMLFADVPFIYVLDSLDSLTTDAELNKTEEVLEVRAEGKKTTGSYNMQKAKMMSEMFRQVNSKLSHTKSMILIVSQIRDNINPMSYQKHTRAGGKALQSVTL